MDIEECKDIDDKKIQGQNITADDSDSELLKIKTDTKQLAVTGENDDHTRQNNGLSKEGILRYDREFLLQLQYDKDVSTIPITLPDIPDLYPNKRGQKPYVHKHYEDRRYDCKNNKSNMETDDTDTCHPLMEMSMTTENENISLSETFQYDDKCFIVVDFEGMNDETDQEKNENVGETKENPSLNTDDIRHVKYGRGGAHENNGKDNHYRRDGRGKGKKRHVEIYDWKEEREIDSKRRRRSPYKGDERMKRHSSCRNRYQKYERKRNASRTFDRRSDKSSGYKRPNIQYDAQMEVSSGGTDFPNEQPIRQTPREESKQTRPRLYENGICVQPGETNAKPDIQEQLLSPVSEGSLSPCADFTVTFNNSTKETSCLDKEIKCHEEDKCFKKIDEQFNTKNTIDSSNIVSRWTQQSIDKNEKVSEGTPSHEGNVYGFNNFHQMHYGTPVQTQPFFQYRNPVPTFPVQYAQHMTPFVPNIHQLPRFNNYMPLQSRRQQHRNNIVVTDSTRIENKKEKKEEPYLISSNTLDTLSISDRNKIVISMYRTMVEAEGSRFTPEEVIGMIKQCRPVVEFASEDALFDFLGRNQDRFLFQKYKRLISPKTDIKLCHKFTNNPGHKHECMDLHICKYYLFGSCTLEKCKFSHRLNSKHNVEVLKCYNLHGISEGNIKKLIQNLNNRNILTTPLVCKFYNNEGGCQREVCMYLHLCTHFISGDCKFQRCKRVHDFNDPQVKNVLEKHGIFPNDSNFDQIRNLLKATLTDGGVKLKRELPNYSKAMIGGGTERYVVNHRSTLPRITSPNSCENIESSKGKEIEIKSSMQSNESTRNDSNTCKQTFEAIQSNNCEHEELNELPDFIPLETSSDQEKEEDISDNTKPPITKALNEVGINQTKNDNEMEESSSQQEANSKILKEGLPDNTEIKSKPLGKPVLPRWKSMIYRKEDNIKVDSVNDKTKHETEADGNVNFENISSKTSEENAEKNTTTSNFNIKTENVDAKETNSLQLDNKPAAGEDHALQCQSHNESTSKPLPEDTFQITGSGYRVRKNGEGWQLQEFEIRNELIDTQTKAVWKDIPEEETNKLKDIYHIFNEVVGKYNTSSMNLKI